MKQYALHYGLIVATFVACNGCSNKVRSTPDMNKPPQPVQTTTTQPVTPHKNWVEKTGDAAWQVVQLPVRLVVPAKKPKVATTDEAPPDAIDATIIQRYPTDTSPATVSAGPATRP